MRGIGREGDGGNTDEVTARRCRGVKLLVSVVIDRYNHRLQLDHSVPLICPQAAPKQREDGVHPKIKTGLVCEPHGTSDAAIA